MNEDVKMNQAQDFIVPLHPSRYHCILWDIIASCYGPIMLNPNGKPCFNIICAYPSKDKIMKSKWHCSISPELLQATH